MHDQSPHLWALHAERSPEMVQKFFEEGIASVVTHEVGHTLGLRHNFRGSTALPFEMAQNASYVEEHGLSSSVMDYLPLNILSDKARQFLKISKDASLAIFPQKIGKYDVWAIRYGYTPIANEACCSKSKILQEIAREYDSADFTFATDEDADEFDPFTARFDLTNDPLLYWTDQLQLVKEAQVNILSRVVKSGESFHRLVDAEERLLQAGITAAFRLSGFIGGFKVSRRHRICEKTDSCDHGGSAGPNALEAVDKAHQLNALKTILNKVLMDTGEEGKSIFPTMKTQESMVAQHDMQGLEPTDASGVVSRVKAMVLQLITDPFRMSRLRQASEMWHHREGKPQNRSECAVSEFLGVLTQELWGMAPDVWLVHKKDEKQSQLAKTISERVHKAVELPTHEGMQLAYLRALRELGDPDGMVTCWHVQAAANTEGYRLREILKTASEWQIIPNDEKKGGQNKGYLLNALGQLTGSA